MFDHAQEFSLALFFVVKALVALSHCAASTVVCVLQLLGKFEILEDVADTADQNVKEIPV
jgi:hypothetical protein